LSAFKRLQKKREIKIPLGSPTSGNSWASRRKSRTPMDRELARHYVRGPERKEDVGVGLPPLVRGKKSESAGFKHNLFSRGR